MKRFAGGFLLGVIVGGLSVAGYFFYQRRADRALMSPSVCYSCFWKGQDPKLRADLIDFYRQYKNPDQLVMADVSFILWRANDQPNCDGREAYRQIAENDLDDHRKYLARSIYAFSGAECGHQASEDYAAAADEARKVGLSNEAELLGRISRKELTPKFEDVAIATRLDVPKSPKTLTLGESKVVITPTMKVGTQVDRVSRDWLSYQLHWDLAGGSFPSKDLITYHEGAVVAKIAQAAYPEIYPLTGTLIAKKGDKWYAPDETGVFRFNVLEDKVEYPTTHAAGSFGVIEDTHGISALVSQALERHVNVVIGCGDSEGKAKAAYYLAQKGVNVIMPGDRYIAQLIGYTGTGVLLGTSPVKQVGSTAVVGDQPVRFSTSETIVVEDTKRNFPLQYYDGAARYFRRLNEISPLKLDFVLVDGTDQISRVLDRADQLGATAVGVRIVDQAEHDKLEAWLKVSPQRRAVLFHSGLYPFAQPLFAEFPTQVTFGDTRPRFQ